LLRGKDGNPLNLTGISLRNPKFPVIDISHDDYPHWKSCYEIFTDKSVYRGKKVIFLVRDPRDVLVSYYFQYTRRNDKTLAGDASFDGTLDDFIRYEIGGLPSIVTFYNVWARQRDIPRKFMLMTYEDLQMDMYRELKRLVKFLNLPDYGKNSMRDAVSKGSFSNMRQLEERQALGDSRLQPHDDYDPDAYKVRRGVVGGYKDYFEAEEIDQINSYINLELDDYYHFYKS